MKIWIDGFQEPPSDDWVHAETLNEAFAFLETWFSKDKPLEAVGYCHDLAYNSETEQTETIRPIILWQIEHMYYPTKAYILANDPVGREYIVGMINRHFEETEFEIVSNNHWD